MKAPLKVLIFSIFVVCVMVVITLYRFDLLRFKIKPSSERATVESATEPMSKTSKPSASTAQAPKQSEPASQAQSKTDLANGKKLYETKTCAMCHGADGASSTSMGKAVAATDLTQSKFKNNNKNLPRLDYILQVIQDGVPGTAMVSFKDQIPNKQDQLDLAAYVDSFHK